MNAPAQEIDLMKALAASLSKAIAHPLPIGTMVEVMFRGAVSLLVIDRVDIASNAYRGRLHMDIVLNSDRGSLWYGFDEVMTVFEVAPMSVDRSWERGGSEDTPFMRPETQPREHAQRT